MRFHALAVVRRPQRRPPPYLAPYVGAGDTAVGPRGPRPLARLPPILRAPPLVAGDPPRGGGGGYDNNESHVSRTRWMVVELQTLLDQEGLAASLGPLLANDSIAALLELCGLDAFSGALGLTSASQPAATCGAVLLITDGPDCHTARCTTVIEKYAQVRDAACSATQSTSSAFFSDLARSSSAPMASSILSSSPLEWG